MSIEEELLAEIQSIMDLLEDSIRNVSTDIISSDQEDFKKKIMDSLREHEKMYPLSQLYIMRYACKGYVFPQAISDWLSSLGVYIIEGEYSTLLTWFGPQFS